MAASAEGMDAATTAAPQIRDCEVKMSAKLHRISSHDGTHFGYMLQCPGCDLIEGASNHHAVNTEKEKEPRWGFNGDTEKPTFTPSVRVRWNQGDPPVEHVCHFNVTDGNIMFHEDSTHALAGKTVPLPEW